MTLFKKKKERQNVEIEAGMPSGTEKDTVRVGSQFPGDTLRPVDYTDHQPFENYKSVLDECLETLFQKEIDAGNADVLDNDIFQAAREAKNDLLRQHEHHRITIDMLLQRRPGTKKELEIELENQKTALKQVREEIAAYTRRSNEYKTGGKTHVYEILQ